MNLVYITASLPYGPSETFVIPEIKEFIRQGHRATVIPTWGRGQVTHADALELLPFTRARDLVSFRILGRALLVAASHPGRALGCLAMLLRGSPKSWIKNLAVVPKAFWLASFALRHEVRHIHAGWASTAATIALLAGRISDIPWSFTAYRWDIIENNLLTEKVRQASFARFISHDGLKLAEHAGVPSSEVAAKVQVIFTGVNVPALASLARTAPAREKLVALCPATLIFRKGHRYLFEALALLQQRGLRIEVQLAGQGPLRDELQGQVRLLGLANDVTFLGQVSHDKLLEWYGGGLVDLVVLPSLHEGMSVALIEALAYALPVVATPVGGNSELLADGTGLVVPPEDAEALADALQRLINNPAERQRLASTGRHKAETLYSIDKIVATLAMSFEAACAARQT